MAGSVLYILMLLFISPFTISYNYHLKLALNELTLSEIEEKFL